MDLVTATDLEQWAERRDAQAQLPRLVRRMIAETANGLTRLSFRAGEGVSLPGWDGIVEAAQPSAFVPAGVSGWEMGVGDPATKARSDYRKRAEDPGDVDPGTTTFVFVTPRRWNGKDEWAKERTDEGLWRAVIVYDADDLETWLETSPAAHAWISPLVGKDPYEVESLETWWKAWSGATRPPFAPAILLSGRAREAEQLGSVISGDASTTSVAADSQAEALAFIAATLLSAGESSSAERALIVRSPSAWNRLALSGSKLLLIPAFDGARVSAAVQAGHQVVLPLGHELGGGRGIELPRLRRAGIEEALRQQGVTAERASVLATLGRRSLLSLRRTLAINPDAEIPLWARPEHAPDIVPAVLGGSWNDNSPGDRAAIEAIAGRPYEEVAGLLTRWLHASDPPVRRVGDVWMIGAKLDAWSQVARAITSEMLTRFRKVAIEVLSAEDPALALEPDQRMMAGLLGRQRQHSGHLLRGIADTLALMASTSEDVSLAGGRRGADEALIVVRNLLEAANEDPTGRRWESLADSLPLLAEAAPSQFLSAVDDGSRTVEGPLLRLFQDGERSSFLLSSSPHPSLLWALETLAWSPKYLPHAALALAVLTRLEPGGKTLNRPFKSLRDILLLCLPGTAATLEERVEVVDLIRRREPTVAWPLMLQLIPAGSESASPTASPTYRDWKPESGDVYVADVVRAADALVSRAVEDAGADGQRWSSLLQRVATTAVPAFERVREALERLDPLAFSSDDRGPLYRTLRQLVAQHREFPDAEWAMPPAVLDRLDRLIVTFEPSGALGRKGWLFEQGSLHAFVNSDSEERHRALYTAQDAALREILAEVGLQGLLDWAAGLPEAEQLFAGAQIGQALARQGHDPKDLLPILIAPRDIDRSIALQFLGRVAFLRGLDWATATLMGDGASWSGAHKAMFLRALPVSPEVWTIAESLGKEVEQLYWAAVHPYAVPLDGPIASLAVEKLILAGQPRTAVYVISMVISRAEEAFPPTLIARALEEVIRTATTPIESTLAHDVGDLLDRLDRAGFDRDRLARLEWTYLPLFRFDKRPSRVLHRALAEDPALFVEAVSLAFRARGEEPRELTEAERLQSQNASDLLDSWRVVPGMQDSGDINASVLDAWVNDARKRLADENRLEIGEELIGHVLRYGPPPRSVAPGMKSIDGEGSDGGESLPKEWPAWAIRDLIESAVSKHIELGIEVEIHNSRGVTSRALTEGGQQERALAARYREYAEVARVGWPRTAAMLVRIAENFERDAHRHDLDADLTEDTWT